uniref:Putative secreted protein n=1 Tax=Anopheles darlingi TaxID=43151 RepID=A0A2M4D1A3_ANODA
MVLLQLLVVVVVCLWRLVAREGTERGSEPAIQRRGGNRWMADAVTRQQTTTGQRIPPFGDTIVRDHPVQDAAADADTATATLATTRPLRIIVIVIVVILYVTQREASRELLTAVPVAAGS